MTTAAARPVRPFDIPAVPRALIAVTGTAMTLAIGIALTKVLSGMVPAHYVLRQTAILIHLATVVPAVPLGAWLLFARKGTPRHKALGKLWVTLMVVTAIAALFIRNINAGQFSWIHIFVPLTLLGAWKAIRTARAGDIAAHRRHLIGMYLGALMIPGAFAFMPVRLMGAWLFG